jgi:serine/threonine-protein kinase
MTVTVQEKKTVKIGDYVVTGKIGQGGIAEIFRGRQESLDRDVAIKILNSKLTKDSDIVRRFQRESLVIAKLNHPNIVHIIDKGTAGDRYYFVMEYVDGTSLKEVIESEAIPPHTKLDMIVQVCKALDYAHKNGVIHRDIKPTNVLIDRQGNAQVADFGIAQIVGTPDSEMTATDIVMGTVAYMSPEQKVSSTNVDHTTDIYAVGVMLYELLIQKKPLGHFKLPSELKPELGTGFDEIILKCLATEPMDRFQSAVELKDAILEVMNHDDLESRKDDFSLNGSESFMGKCRYLDTIKETKFSSTILVENKLTKRLYVIKKHNKGQAGRKEAKLLKSLKHKNIITIYGSGGDERSTVIIAEYAQGGSLADRMVRPYEWEKAFEITLQVAAGLNHAHKNNIVHGNLRPSNVLFRADNQVALTDFGMPVHYDGSGRRNWYSSPERKPSRQGDIYGLGVILHQLLINRNPAYDSAQKVSLDDLKGHVPRQVVEILSKLLAIRIADRYQSCEELLADWELFQKQLNEKLDRKAEPLPDIDAPAQIIPTWVYPAVALGLIGVVLLIMSLAGVFK